MGAAARALSVAGAIGLALVTRSAHADGPCRVPDPRGGTYAVCFDPANRLRLDLGARGVGLGVDLRTRVETDDLRIHHRVEQSLGVVRVDAKSVGGAVYALRWTRHSAEGSLVLPTSPPRQISLPFDLGLELSTLRFEGARDGRALRVGVARLAPLADFARSSDGRLRLALGPVARWDATVNVPGREAGRHDVAPFTLVGLSLQAESKDGLTLARLVAEGGWERSGEAGFRRAGRAELLVERVVLAVNDHPVSIFVGAAHDPGFRGDVVDAGLRLALVTRRIP